MPSWCYAAKTEKLGDRKIGGQKNFAGPRSWPDIMPISVELELSQVVVNFLRLGVGLLLF